MNEFEKYNTEKNETISVNNNDNVNVTYTWVKDEFSMSDERKVNSIKTGQSKHKRRKIKNINIRPWKLGMAILAAGLIGGIIFGSAFAFVGNAFSKTFFGSNLPQEMSQNPQSSDSKFYSIEDAAKKNNHEKNAISIPQIANNVGPAVVGVINMATYRGMSSASYEQGSGSGIIISKDGYIVTNNHVVENASEVKVMLNNSKEYSAKIIGTDYKTDLAVIKIDETDLTYATLGDSSTLEVGELAVAIGNPLGKEFAGSVTAGIISALNRTVTVEDKQLTLIQTDAAINAGNSGGALVNCYGEVIGINTVKISGSGIENLGFAIPINEAKPIIEELKSNGYVTGRPLFGISCRDITEEISRAYGFPVGIYVIQVSPFSGAEKAGITAGDIITEFDGKKVKTTEELNKIKDKHKAGDSVKVKFIRDGKTLECTVVLSEEKPSAQN